MHLIIRSCKNAVVVMSLIVAYAIFVPDTFAQESIVEEPLMTQTLDVWADVILLWHNFVMALPMLTLGLVFFIICYALARPISTLLVRPIGYVSQSELIRLVTRRTISLLIILLGLYVFLRFAGLSEFAIAIVSGTGVMGLILGFAFRDIAENFISSLLLSVQKPFKIDDVIEVQGQLGIVKQVTARATTLVDFDGNHIQIPNATIYKNIIRNLTANPKMRGKFTIGIGYDSSILEAQQLATKVLCSQNTILQDPEPQVLVDELGSSTVNLKVYFWIDAQQYSLLKVSSMLMRLIMREFERNNISMPDDAREIIFPQGVPVHQISSGKSDSSYGSQALRPLPANNEAIEQDSDAIEHQDDLSSDTHDIRQQAKQARDPEQGQNIL
ncbi:MAG: mechanosensitive ion channel family protein [Alteromonadaceae bacterium]|uniref:Small-conductance mechanosensitive channel n=1 Tax=Paraglaciecola mesophila KMM 241 TaxID=1128912 RepID=K6Z320_9ALTE|nr:mechanosensitive ion channel family protein [Paraglaciecola mesophila]MAD17834.1 mechanosensitive ion channel family protein [Alteromonadaceae bacterium]MBB19554.1 mechanosensitive ion channel family protein [Rickettsiales bacterium]GAC23388.1 mechanosensitive channel protein [Paraglaciecola mesophila KMM 241]